VEDTAPAVDIFWSGGWDSTFRILQLVLLSKRVVQPHYLIDAERKSTLFELRAMAAVRAALADIDAEAPGRILPLRTTLVSDIPPEPEITAHYRGMRELGVFGTQYEWMARYAEHEGIQAIEVCDYQSSNVAPFIAGKTVTCETVPGVSSYRVADKHLAGDLSILRRFSFPSFSMMKRDTLELARVHGFRPILDLTWFCHRPIKGRPCGTCNPCRYVIKDHMLDRMPRSALIRHRLDRIMRCVRRPRRIGGAMFRPASRS
jgi:hypothetical protein